MWAFILWPSHLRALPGWGGFWACGPSHPPGQRGLDGSFIHSLLLHSLAGDTKSPTPTPPAEGVSTATRNTCPQASRATGSSMTLGKPCAPVPIPRAGLRLVPRGDTSPSALERGWPRLTVQGSSGLGRAAGASTGCVTPAIPARPHFLLGQPSPQPPFQGSGSSKVPLVRGATVWGSSPAWCAGAQGPLFGPRFPPLQPGLGWAPPCRPGLCVILLVTLQL